MDTIKKQFIKLCMVSVFAVIPYVGAEASVAGDHSTVNFKDKRADLVAIRVRSGEVRASPVRRAAVRGDAVREERYDEQTPYEEQRTEPTEQQYIEPQRVVPDRGRPGGRR